MRHVRGIEVYRAINPKTKEVFVVTGSEERDHGALLSSAFRQYVLRARPDRSRPGTRAGEAIVVTDSRVTPASLHDYARIHSNVSEEHRYQGVGALLYITAAIFAGRQGAAGIWSSGGSSDARQLWKKLVKHGLATETANEAGSIYTLTAREADATRLAFYRGKLGRRLKDGGSWG